MRSFMLTILASLVADSVQDCCVTPFGYGAGCCGNGPCNFFCCNCDNSCDWECVGGRERSFKRMTAGYFGITISNSQLRFDTVDTNRDGIITEEEGMNFLLHGTVSARVKRDIKDGKWLAEMDTNGDGVIQPAEFDHSLAGNSTV